MTTPSSANPSRACLINRLHQASEAEHSLCCQYLYAAFSLRRNVADFPAGLPEETVALAMSATQHWGYQIFYVARQEMEHLGIVTNLLSAVGERPYLVHGDFPDPALAAILQTEMVLERCNEDALRRFQFIERPAQVLPGPAPAVEAIYGAIKKLFTELPAAVLFTGDGQRQINETDVSLGLSMKVLPVTNRATAVRAIDLVLEQGEGLGASPTSKDTHYARFTEVLQDYMRVTSALSIEPSLPVVKNPVSRPGPAGTTLVTNAFSAALMDLFDEGYRLMLIMLKEFFWGFRDFSGLFQAVEALQTPEALEAHRRMVILSENAYYPFMTMFIRPMGELLARQPALIDVADPARAGAAFRTGGAIPIWSTIDPYLEALATLAGQVARLANDAPDRMTQAALVYLNQNLTRMRTNIIRVDQYGG